MERYIVMRILFGLFLLVVAIFIIVQLATSGGGSDEQPGQDSPVSEQADIPFIPSNENNDSSAVTFTIQGKTNALEEHRECRFTITQNNRQVDLVQGYDGRVLKSIRLPNTPNSYQELLNALEAEGYTRERVNPTVTDPRGQCSHGKKYFYRASTNGLNRSDLWSTSCSLRKGTFGGDRRAIVRLFERQFPDFSDFERGVKL